MSNTTKIVGQRAREHLGSAIPVEAGARVPSDSKDTKDTVRLGIMVLPGSGQVGIRPSPPKR